MAASRVGAFTLKEMKRGFWTGWAAEFEEV
jgi:hypothetical protein